MSVLIIDNKDSFTFNLVELFRSIQAEEPIVISYEEIHLEEWQKHPFLVISPGPGLPEDFPKYQDLIGHLLPGQSLLGVCMGHEIIACHFGGGLEQMEGVSHGIAGEIVTTATNESIFSGLEEPIKVGLYHSWIVSDSNFPECLEVTARDQNGRIMALQHRQLNIRSVQFHPESYITGKGKEMMRNWLMSDLIIRKM